MSHLAQVRMHYHAASKKQRQQIVAWVREQEFLGMAKSPLTISETLRHIERSKTSLLKCKGRIK
jgi:hypothetical protein